MSYQPILGSSGSSLVGDTNTYSHFTPTAANVKGSLTGIDSALASMGSGTVTTLSVVTANGLAGTVANPTTTPAITLSTSITGLLKGNGTAISAATSGTDYSAGTSALSTGILKSTTTTGALTIAIASDFPVLNQNTTGTAASVTGTNVVTNSNLAQMAMNTIKGNNTGGTANAADLTVAQVNAILPIFTTSLNGLTPLSGGGTTNYLRADGTWTSPPGVGTVTSVGLADGSTAPIYGITNSPVTGSGTLTFTLSNQSANTVLCGPATGSAAQPTFRALVAADIPSLSGTYLPLAGGTMSGTINMGTNAISAVTTLAANGLISSTAADGAARFGAGDNATTENSVVTNIGTLWGSYTDSDNSTGTAGSLLGVAHNSIGAGKAVILVMSRGTKTSPVIVNNGDNLGNIYALGYDGTEYQTSSEITFGVGAAPGTNIMPGTIVFRVAPSGSNITAKAVQINPDKSMSFSGSIHATGQLIDGVLSLASNTANSAGTGLIRLATTDTITWRNNGNSADIALGKNTSDQLTWAGTAVLSNVGILLATAFPALTGDVTTSAGSLATTIAANAVTNAKAAQMATLTIKGNNTGSTANAADLTVAQTLTMLGIFSGKTTISNGSTSVAVTFSTAYAGTSYSVTANLLNTTDTNPQFQPITITAQSTTGFTASWNAPTATANYTLSWQAILSN